MLRIIIQTAYLAILTALAAIRIKTWIEVNIIYTLNQHVWALEETSPEKCSSNPICVGNDAVIIRIEALHQNPETITARIINTFSTRVEHKRRH